MPEPLSHLTSSGGLLSNQFLAAIRQESFHHDQVRPERFGLPWQEAPKGAALEDTIATAWELLLEQWEKVRGNWNRLDLPALRSRWIAPFFTTLDFDLQYQRAALEVGAELRFVLSHRGWKGEHAPVVHSVLPRPRLDTDPSLGLDTKAPDAPRGARSPHDTLQSFLNAAPQDTWAILTNGILLRLLRDFHHTYTKGFVQFDLEGIFETRNFADFRALYRLCHANRFLPGAEGSCPLEQFYRTSQATGIAVGEDLRGQVKEAIQGLGNGFVSGELLGQLQEDEEACRQFYGEVLHVIYRILFLLFAEQRGMLPGRNSLYAEEYSIARLRERAEGQIPQRDEHGDLWETLKVTFRMVSRGVPKLGIFGYDGMLFDEVRTPILDRSYCRNSELLRAIRYLTLIDKGGVLQRISYADLSVEEIGSIYESLLDYTPRVTRQFERFEAEEGGRNRSFEVPGNTFFLDPRGGSRKTSGSYYTRPALVNELIKSALVPVLEERLQEAGYDPQKPLEDYTTAERKKLEEALLSLRVCDAGGGSGAFLIAANDYLGRRLAQLQAGEEYVTDEQVRRAKREVLQHCIYGVDLNLMAVELAKVSLWINAAVQDLPLNFLDHRIKVGNSLIGATPMLLKEGIPDEAFNPVEGDDPAVARSFKKRNKEQRLGALTLLFGQQAPKMGNLPGTFLDLAQIDESTPEGVQQKAQTYAEVVHSTGYEFARLWADAWCAAFFWPLTAETDLAPTEEIFRRLEQSPYSVSKDLKAQIRALAEKYRFFHWHLEFPEVFGPEGEGGFDVYLGNPPWEHTELKEKEWFATRRPDFASARTGADRKQMISALASDDPALFSAFQEARREHDTVSYFISACGRYPLCGRGRINTYAVFTEAARNLINVTGRVGILVPSGIATDDTTKYFFQSLMDEQSLLSLYDFENSEALFPGVHRSYKFCLLTLAGPDRPVPAADFAFFATQVEHLREDDRHFTLSAEDIAFLNPNTRTCPVFRSKRDAEITRFVYRRVPVLVKEGPPEENPWGVSFKQGLFNMTSDSGLFRTRDQLESDGGRLEGNVFQKGDVCYLPLYEAKMVSFYDHRAAHVITSKTAVVRQGQPEKLNATEHNNPNCHAIPRYWVPKSEVDLCLAGKWDHDWLLGWCDITSPTNERTVIASILPRVGIGHTCPIMFSRYGDASLIGCLQANLSAIALDFIARQKIGGIHLTYNYLNQLPVLPPSTYTQPCPWSPGQPLADWLLPRVLELTYTAWDLEPFAKDCGYCGPPFRWDEERRFLLRCELDACYFHLYGIERNDVDYILETFPIVRRKDEAQYGVYRTKRVILEIYDALAEAAQTGRPYQTRLSPEPADPAVAHPA